MKKHFKVFLLLTLFMLGKETFAQRLQTDPGYSNNNYKHPNKTNIKKSDSRQVTEIKLLKSRELDVGNYKSQKIKSKPEVIPVKQENKGDKSGSNQNYKQQFKPTGL